MLCLHVSGMTCRDCVRAISSHLADVPGVRSVQISLADGTVHITGHAAADEVEQAIQRAGYHVCRPTTPEE